MNNALKNLLAVSVTINILSVLAYVGINEELKVVKENRQKIHNYATLLRNLLTEHYKNGGALRVTEEMQAEVDAYMVFAKNGMG